MINDYILLNDGDDDYVFLNKLCEELKLTLHEGDLVLNSFRRILCHCIIIFDECVEVQTSLEGHTHHHTMLIHTSWSIAGRRTDDAVPCGQMVGLVLAQLGF
jgi:hypothetical protein